VQIVWIFSPSMRCFGRCQEEVLCATYPNTQMIGSTYLDIIDSEYNKKSRREGDLIIRLRVDQPTLSAPR